MYFSGYGLFGLFFFLNFFFSFYFFNEKGNRHKALSPFSSGICSFSLKPPPSPKAYWLLFSLRGKGACSNNPASLVCCRHQGCCHRLFSFAVSVAWISSMWFFCSILSFPPALPEGLFIVSLCCFCVRYCIRQQKGCGVEFKQLDVVLCIFQADWISSMLFFLIFSVSLSILSVNDHHVFLAEAVDW